MTLAAKYNEAMERLQLTEEAKERILNHVSEAMKENNGAGKAAKMIRFPNWKRWGTLAACLALVLIGAIVWNPAQSTPGNNDTQVMSPGNQVLVPLGDEEYTSAEELSETIGFPVEDIDGYPYVGNEIHYENLFNEIAQISVLGDHGQICFRKAVGTDDISGDYNDYSVIKEVTLEGVVITLKGNDDLFSLAVWQHAGYTYSMSIEPPAPVEVMTALVDSIIKQ